MRLTKEEKEICKQFGQRDEKGYVHCRDCPLAIDLRYALCKANCHADEWHEHLERVKGE